MFKVIKRILGISRPFTHNPEDFRLRIVPAWFSDEYASFEYSANGGESWKTIYAAESPYLGNLDYNWEWKPLAYKIYQDSTFKHEREKFSSYQKILDYEAEQTKRFREGQASIEKQRQEIAERKREQWKKINS